MKVKEHMKEKQDYIGHDWLRIITNYAFCLTANSNHLYNQILPPNDN